jgi:AcrR family transcriptional regulator
MFKTTLQMLIDQGATSAREVAELAGVSTSTVYRWVSGQSQPDFDSVRLLIRHLPNRKAQQALLDVLITGTCWQLSHAELDLDVNHDGRIDTDDALDASVEAVRCAAESLATVRDANRGQSLSADQTLRLIALLNDVVRQCTITQRVLVELSEARRKRKLKLVDG